MLSENLLYQVGQQIEAFTIKRFLGRGTYGEVYQVEWEIKNRGIKQAAVKVVIDSKFRDILREVAVWGRVSSHENILTFLNSDIIDNRVWLFSEYIKKGSLKGWLESGDKRFVTYQDYVRLIVGILQGLNHLHQYGILHRDLKPANILMKGDSTDQIKDDIPLLADFGLARNLDLMQSAGLSGTIWYNPPEWVEIYLTGKESEQKNYIRTEHDDLWALTVILQELIMNKRPFLTIKDILNCDPIKLSSDIPKQLRYFCERQLQKERKRRFQSTSEMLLEMESIARALDIQLDNVDKSKTKTEGKPPSKLQEQLSSEEEAQKYFNLGLKCSDNDYDCIIFNYSKAIEFNPSFATAYNNRGKAYKNKGHYDQAIKDYSKAIELKPNYVSAYNNRANAYYLKGHYDQAIKDYSKAIELKPNYVSAYNNRANAYAKKKNFDQAIKDYTKAIELNPNDEDLYKNLKNAHVKLKERKI